MYLWLQLKGRLEMMSTPNWPWCFVKMSSKKLQIDSWRNTPSGARDVFRCISRYMLRIMQFAILHHHWVTNEHFPEKYEGIFIFLLNLITFKGCCSLLSDISTNGIWHTAVNMRIDYSSETLNSLQYMLYIFPKRHFFLIACLPVSCKLETQSWFWFESTLVAKFDM